MVPRCSVDERTRGKAAVWAGTASSARAGNDELGCVEADLVGVLGGPNEAGLAVLNEGHAADVRCEAVVDGDHDGAKAGQPVEGDVDLGEAVSHHHAATV